MTIAPERADLEELDFPTPAVEPEPKVTAADIYAAVEKVKVDHRRDLATESTLVENLLRTLQRESGGGELIGRTYRVILRLTEMLQTATGMNLQVEIMPRPLMAPPEPYVDYRGREHYCYCSPGRREYFTPVI